MRTLFQFVIVFLFVISALCAINVYAQDRHVTITGRVLDASEGVLPGARIKWRRVGLPRFQMVTAISH